MSEILIQTTADLERIKKAYQDTSAGSRYQVLVCGGAGCVSSNCGDVKDAVVDEIARIGLKDEVIVRVTGCIGTCAAGPVMLVLPDRVFYTKLTPEIARTIVKKHLGKGEVLEEYTFYDYSLKKHIPKFDDIDFFKEQVRIALRNCGVIEFDSLDAYISRDGYFAAAKALNERTPQEVIDEIKRSGMRGRGGAGFPTGIKWQAGHDAAGERKFIVCNADEGDPGAFMDRSILEGDPNTVIEGMMIGGYAIGAHKGYVYVRAEYPLAIERLEKAIEAARARGVLGENVFGSGFDFDLEID